MAVVLGEGRWADDGGVLRKRQDKGCDDAPDPFCLVSSRPRGPAGLLGLTPFYSSITRLERPGLRPWCVSEARPTMRALAHWPAEAAAQHPG